MSIIIAAPHLSFPIKNADDKLIWNRSILFKEIFDLTIIIGMNHVIVLEKGEQDIFKKYSKSKKNKFYAFFKTLIYRSDYKYNKFISSDFLKEYFKVFKKYKPKNVLISYLQTAIALQNNNLLLKNINYICETHNDEWTWNDNNQLSLNYYSRENIKKNPLKIFHNRINSFLYSFISQSSKKWLSNNISKLPRELKIICLSKNDFESLSIRLKKFPLYLITPSINEIADLKECKKDKIHTEKDLFNLLFVGSLDMKMNIDAIIFFCKKFNNEIQKKFGKNIRINIVGRNPSQLIKGICREKEFNLYSDVSNIMLLNLYKNSDLLIMPFPYNCGFKLKFIEAIENGIPILGTECVNFSSKDKLPNSLFSNDKKKWLKHIELLTFFSDEEYKNSRKNIQEYSTHYSKEKIKKMFTNILKI